MTARPRRAGAVLAVGLALVGLTGCDRPTPAVTLYSGGTSIHDDAMSYCFDGQDPQAEPGTKGACRIESGRTPKVLRVRPGDLVTIDVDKDLADSAWFAAIRIEGRPDTRVAASDDHVARFQPDFGQGVTQLVDVRKQAGEEQNAKVVGLWTFLVVPR